MTVTQSENLPGNDRPPDAEPPQGGRRVRQARTAPPWWFALPALLLFAFVVLVPSVRGVHYAFTDWDGLDPASPSWAWTTSPTCSAIPMRCKRSGTRC